MFLAMPVPMQIYSKIQSDEDCPITVRDGRQWLDHICAEKGIKPVHRDMVIENSKNRVKEKSEKKVLLECKDLWFRYEKDTPDVVKGLNMKLYEGEFYCLLGGNGTGKTTTVSLISRLRKPYRGKVLLNDKVSESLLQFFQPPQES